MTATSRARSPAAAIRKRSASRPARTSICSVPTPTRQNDLDHGGEIYKLELNGTVVGKFGQAGKGSKDFGSVNAIDCRSANTLYVAEAGNWRVTKVDLHC